MSFATKIKTDLLRTENKQECCAAAELCGIICYGGTISRQKDGSILKISTENAASARRCFTLLKRVFGVSGEIVTSKSRARRGGNAYTIVLANSAAVDIVLLGLELYDGRYEGLVSYRISASIEERPCCRRAFIRGAFLGAGSVTNPEKEYHLEFSTNRLNLSRDFTRLLAYFDINAKTVTRKSNYVTYLKNTDDIGDVLNIIGAHNAYMELMNIRIWKDKRNNVNRQVNCETANMDKTLDAAYLQQRAIEKLQCANKFETLPPPLLELAQLRLQYNDASLTELSQMLHISKSGVNHRFRRLIELAEGLE